MIDITERLRKLSIAVSEQNWQEFSMRVPAEPDRDADIVIMQAAMLIESMRQQLASRDAEVAEYMLERTNRKATEQSNSKLLVKIAAKDAEIAELVAALELLSKYIAYNGDDWVQRTALEALAKVRKP